MYHFIKEIAEATQQDPLPSEIYVDVFLKSESGKKVLKELLNMYWFNKHSDETNPYQTYLAEGKRTVVTNILQKLVTAHKGESSLSMEIEQEETSLD